MLSRTPLKSCDDNKPASLQVFHVKKLIKYNKIGKFIINSGALLLCMTLNTVVTILMSLWF